METEFQSNYAVNMSCQDCADTVEKALLQVKGISEYRINVQDQTVFIRGSALPSEIISAVEATGKDAVLRGSGVDGQSAVCILEDNKGGVWGLIRLVGTLDKHVIVDISVSAKLLQSHGGYTACICKYGDISHVPESAGPILMELLGISSPSASTRLVFDLPSVIGRSIVLLPKTGTSESYLSGVIARSAGLWGNDKEVCACSGRTLWEERKAARSLAQ